MDLLPGVLRGFKLLSGNANRGLAEEIARNLGVELCRMTLTRFAPAATIKFATSFAVIGTRGWSLRSCREYP